MSPFLALRDYNGQPGQWGSEPDPASFLDHLLELTAELRRVLAPHGSIAIELGDTFAGSGGAGGDYTAARARDGQPRFDGSAKAARGGRKNDRVQGEGHAAPIRNLNGKVGPSGPGWPLPKSLCGTPTLFAWSLAYGRNLLREPMSAAELLAWVDGLRAAGWSAEGALAAAGGWVAHHGIPQRFDPWLVRNVIVWARNNPPVGALGDKVRPATSYITVACPSPRRWFDLDAVRTEPTGVNYGRQSSWNNLARKVETGRPKARNGESQHYSNPAGAPPLDHWHDEPDGDLLWLINTQGSSLAHYAMWPPKLCERLILSMCPAQVCRTCGEPRRRITGPAEYVGRGAGERDPWAWGGVAKGKTSQARYEPGHISRSAPTLGWSDCGHGDYRPGHVLDTFAGTGTTLAVADILGRDATGVDLDPANPALYPARWAQCWKALRADAGPPPITPAGQQLGLAI